MTTAGVALELALIALALPVLAASAYLGLLALLARAPPLPAAVAPRTRFAVVVPAHDEAAGIAETVRAALTVRWPAELRRVVVVADNCADDTAAHARDAGAVVIERQDAERRGKGYALDLAFRRLVEEGWADAVVVVDADTVMSDNLLEAFAARLERGAAAVQAHYGVRNPRASWRTRLMTIAFALFHQVRSLARERLGLSCGLRGNGMCFRTSLLAQIPHDAFSIVEDVEYGVRLGRAGHRVHYAWDAEVLGEMVSHERAARSQRQRWEQGRFQLARQVGLPLLREALAKRDRVLLDLSLDLLVPPLSQLVLAAAVGSAAALGVTLWTGGVAVAAPLLALADLCLVGYVFAGWRASGMGARGLVDLAGAPFYVGWKLWLALTRRGPRGEWVRTMREGETRR